MIKQSMKMKLNHKI